MRPLPLAAALLSVATALQAAPDSVALEWAPAADSAVTFTQNHVYTSRFTELEDILNGQSKPVELPTIEWSTEEAYAWRDRIAAVAQGGAVLAVERTFDRLTRTRRQASGAEQGAATLEFGALQDAVIAIERADAASAWQARYVAPEEEDGEAPVGPGAEGSESGAGEVANEDQAAAQWLAGFAYEPAFAGFLPPSGSAVVGTEWTVGLDAWRAVLRPAGDAAYLGADGAVIDDSIDTDLQANMTGTVTCTLEGATDAAATIAIVVDVQSKMTVDGQLENDDPSVLEQHFRRSIGLDGDYTATLTWDRAAGRASAFQMQGTALWQITETTNMTFENGMEWNQGKRMLMTADHSLTAQQ